MDALPMSFEVVKCGKALLSTILALVRLFVLEFMFPALCQHSEHDHPAGSIRTLLLICSSVACCTSHKSLRSTLLFSLQLA